MKRAAGTVIALALTWDGARWPVKSLPAQARAFLKAGEVVPAPSTTKVATLFRDYVVKELRICWVPRLMGGDDVLADPFVTGDGKRLPFRAVRQTPFGDVLGVVYKR